MKFHNNVSIKKNFQIRKESIENEKKVEKIDRGMLFKSNFVPNGSVLKSMKNYLNRLKLFRSLAEKYYNIGLTMSEKHPKRSIVYLISAANCGIKAGLLNRAQEIVTYIEKNFEPNKAQLQEIKRIKQNLKK